MIRLVRKVPRLAPIPRLWIVFFSDASGRWWTKAFRPGFRHVFAAAWFADQERWVVFDPLRHGLVLQVLRGDEFNYGALLAASHTAVRINARFERLAIPPVFYCVGAVKALLGLRSAAVTPYGLYRALRRIGAEIVERPCVGGVAPSPAPSQNGPVLTEAAADPAGGPGREALARN